MAGHYPLTASVVGDALSLARATGPLVVVGTVAIALAHIAGNIGRHRAMRPRVPWMHASAAGFREDCAVSIARVLSWMYRRSALPRGRSAREMPVPAPNAPVRSDGPLARGAGVAGGVVGMAILSLGGHVPTLVSVGFVLAALVTVTVVMLPVVRCRWTARDKRLLLRRAPQIAAAVIGGESAAACSTLFVIAVVGHHAGFTAITVLEGLAVALVARMALRIAPVPWGLGVAEAALVVPLVWIGAPVATAVAVALVWRGGMILAVFSGSAAALWPVDRHVPAPEGVPSDSRTGRRLHRGSFAVLSLLPDPVRTRVRRSIFDRLFTAVDDPWDYGGSPYELRKRRRLVEVVGPSPGTLLEFGCADGHNLCALAIAYPQATVLGVDVAHAAVDAARQRTRGLPNVRLAVTGESSNDEEALGAGRVIDTLILSEVLYYLGGRRGMTACLADVGRRLRPGARVVMVHGAIDGQLLHELAIDVLDLDLVEHHVVDDVERDYVMTVSIARQTAAVTRS